MQPPAAALNTASVNGSYVKYFPSVFNILEGWMEIIF